jgi:anti-sigma factor RsiW
MDKPSSEERIERYLRNNMNDAERRGFEQDLETNEELRTALETMKSIKDALGWNRSLGQLDKELEQEGFFDQLAKEDQPVRKPRRMWMAIAAAVTLLLVAGLAYLFNPQTTDWNELAMVSVKEIDLEVAGMRSPEATDTSLFSRALTALAQQDYAAASDLLQAIPDTHPEYSRIQLLRAYAALVQEDYQQVMAITQAMMADGEPSLATQKAEWLRVKASVGLQAPDRALLEQIAQNPEHRFANAAEALVADLP